MDDLASLDPDLYHGLVFLKQYTGDFEDLALNFTAAIEGLPSLRREARVYSFAAAEFGATRSIDLIPGGAATPVTRENALRYIFLVAHFRLSRQIARQSAAFFEGLSEVVDPAWLRMFDQRELQILLGGVDAPVDVDDLRAHTLYGGAGYADGEPTIAMFWKVVAGFGPEERRKLLKFVTSCSRPPLLYVLRQYLPPSS
jgi:ubiquitin-protein ligase E3 C